ncbi:Centromere protein I [Paramyrothecium foliicola]|nr:Centromere protein I [Paramyrothecium foliicola]
MAATAHGSNLNELIREVVSASKRPAKSRASDVKPTVAQVASLAYDGGLLPAVLRELVELLTTPSHLDQASLNTIIRSLYPASEVPRSLTLRILASLGHGELKPSLNIQAALLRWLIMVYHLLEKPATLSQAYPVLFNLLDTAALRPHLCHLLALITRRKHVQPFRIQLLLNLSRQAGSDPHLIGLLRVFKDYYPEIIVGEAVRGRASAFKHPDAQWRERLDEIQAAHLQQNPDLLTKPRDGFRVNRPVGRTVAKKSIPLVHTSHATEDSVTLEEIETASGFVQNLDKLELPNQLVAVLADPLLQKLLILRPNPESYQRILNWLNSLLQDVLDGEVEEEALWEALAVVKEFVTQTKALPTLFLNFFASFFRTWNGIGQRHVLFEILAYTPFQQFNELYQHIFQPLENAVLDGSHETFVSLLAMYTRLFHYWTTLLQANDTLPDHASDIVAGLTAHVNDLALSLVQAFPSVTTDSAVLDYFEQTCRLVTDNSLVNYMRIELPSAMLVYTFFFSSSAATVSRICYVLACYKRGFELAMSNKARQDRSQGMQIPSYNRAYVGLYNGFLMDICNCLWRARAFGDADANAQGCLVPRPTVAALTAYVPAVEKTFSLPSLFSLSHSPVLCSYSIQSIRSLEDTAMDDGNPIQTRHAGPVTQASLAKLATSGGIRVSWQDYRIRVLESLSAKDLAGVAELLKSTMTILRTSMDGRTASEARSSQ